MSPDPSILPANVSRAQDLSVQGSYSVLGNYSVEDTAGKAIRICGVPRYIRLIKRDFSDHHKKYFTYALTAALAKTADVIHSDGTREWALKYEDYFCRFTLDFFPETSEFEVWIVELVKVPKRDDDGDKPPTPPTPTPPPPRGRFREAVIRLAGLGLGIFAKEALKEAAKESVKRTLRDDCPDVDPEDHTDQSVYVRLRGLDYVSPVRAGRSVFVSYRSADDCDLMLLVQNAVQTGQIFLNQDSSTGTYECANSPVLSEINPQAATNTLAVGCYGAQLDAANLHGFEYLRAAARTDVASRDTRGLRQLFEVRSCSGEELFETLAQKKRTVADRATKLCVPATQSDQQACVYATNAGDFLVWLLDEFDYGMLIVDGACALTLAKSALVSNVRFGAHTTDGDRHYGSHTVNSIKPLPRRTKANREFAFTMPVVPDVDVYLIRHRLGDTPAQFASRLGVAVETVNVWEREDSALNPALRMLLACLAAAPDEITRELALLRAEY